jgi:hypothetical protein
VVDSALPGRGFMKKVKRENVFIALSSIKAEPNDNGRQQFIEDQSRGIKPENPDSYYLALCNGKWNLDFLNTEHREMFYSGRWWGLLQLWKDFEGVRFVLPYILKGWHEIPEWIDKEITEDELKRKYAI